MSKIEQGMTPGALASGQRPEGLGPGGQTPKDLGPGEVEKMFGPAPTPRQRLEGQEIEFVESEMKVGVSVY